MHTSISTLFQSLCENLGTFCGNTGSRGRVCVSTINVEIKSKAQTKLSFIMLHVSFQMLFVSQLSVRVDWPSHRASLGFGFISVKLTTSEADPQATPVSTMSQYWTWRIKVHLFIIIVLREHDHRCIRSKSSHKCRVVLLVLYGKYNTSILIYVI